MAGDKVPPEFSPLLNLTDAAKAVGISRKTLYQHIDKGLVSVTKKQGKRYLHVAELERHYGSVTLQALPGNNTTQLQSTQKDDQIAALTAAVQELQKETQQLRADVQEARKAAENAAQSVSEGMRLIEDKSQQVQQQEAAKEVSTASRSWWRKLWD